MTPRLPPLDLHAHISTNTQPKDLERLGAVVFAATRSLDEYETTINRRDQVTIWGLGCHPGVPQAQNAYDSDRFVALLPSTAYVSEIGLEERSTVPMEQQVSVLRSILGHLELTPRIVSIHSSGATGKVLDILEQYRLRGVVLHWWRGDESQTRRAVDLGCWFSVNAAGVKYPAKVAQIPLNRILTETDHPSGDRSSTPPRQPGAISDVETGLARIYGITADAVRQQCWLNFARLVDQAAVTHLLPRPVQRMLAAVSL